MAKALLMAAGFTTTWMVASVAAADPRDPAAAQALFDEGRALMKTQQYAEACPKLAESQRLDPGIGTQFRLADCYERQGKVASAWAAFLEVASLSGAANQPDREKTARERATRLESRLPRLAIVVPPASRIPDLQIMRDGVAVGEAQWGTRLPIDPGEHQITATAPGRRPFSTKVSLPEGTPTSLEVPLLEPATATADASPVPTPVPTQSAQVQPPAATSPPMPSEPAVDQGKTEPSSSGPNYLVIGLGGLGVIGVAAGTTLGLMARSKFEDSKGHCSAQNENRCSQQGLDERNDAFTLGNGATAGFIVGGAALAGAGILWFTSGSSKSTKTEGQTAHALSAGLQATPKHAGVVVVGSF